MTTSRPAPRLAARLRTLELALFIAGIAALLWLGATRMATARDQATWARDLETQIAAHPSAATGAHAGTPPPRPARTANGVVGRVEVRRVGLSAMAREGTDPALLERAVGHIPGTAMPGETGNAAFAGHRDTFFRTLEDVRAGDEILVTTYSGRHRYVVRTTRVVSPREVSVLDPTADPTLTLITCFPFRYIGPAPERFIVQADLVRQDARATPR